MSKTGYLSRVLAHICFLCHPDRQFQPPLHPAATVRVKTTSRAEAYPLAEGQCGCAKCLEASSIGTSTHAWVRTMHSRDALAAFSGLAAAEYAFEQHERRLPDSNRIQHPHHARAPLAVSSALLRVCPVSLTAAHRRSVRPAWSRGRGGCCS
eukprot:1732133-Rhodomonas_salina.1